MFLKTLALSLLISTSAMATFSSDPAASFKLAHQTKRPLLISFFGIWCPPCNELEETVFESKGFLEKAKSFVLLKVDADKKDSWGLKDKYHVGGYPTVVFTNSQGKELYRVVGYLSEREFTGIMDMVVAAKNQDLAQSCGSSNTDDLWRCATICSETKDKKCAEAAYHKLESRLQPGTPRYDDARTYFVENAPTPDLKREGYEQLLGEFTLSPKAVIWSMDYLQFMESQDWASRVKKPLLEKVLVKLSKIQNVPNLEEYGVEVSDLLEARAILLERLGKKDEANQAWKKVTEYLEVEAKTLPAGSPARGFTLERIEALTEGEELDSAYRLANDYRQRFPDEFTFHYLAASILEQQKKYNDAIPIAKRAFDLSYGDNRVRVATLLIRLYATIPDRGAASRIYDQVTREIKPDPSLDIRTSRYLHNLDDIWKKFPAS